MTTAPEAAETMEVTDAWLDGISTDAGLTRGQKALLNIWCRAEPYTGKQIPVFVARFVEKSKGHQLTRAQVLALTQSNRA